MKSPLGEREGQTLEFKSADALKRPESIAREVVSMLNARKGRGYIWIGVVEHDGIATKEEELAHPDRAREDLLNALLDRIDPEPRAEATVRVVSGEVSRNMLLIEVDPQAGPWRGPFALKKQGLTFVTRVDHRVRPMTRDEILGSGSTADAPDKALMNLRDRRDSMLRRGGSWVWTAVQPQPVEAIDLRSLRGELGALLSDPAAAGNRRSGWTYGQWGIAPELDARARPEKKLKLRDPDHVEVSIAEDACVEFTGPLQRIENHMKPGSREIHPVALLEHVTSALRLSRALLSDVLKSRSERVLVDVALIGTSGWTIPQYAPGTHGDRHRDFWPPRALEEALLAKPLSFGITELRENPDHLGFRLVREVYELSGLQEEHIAPEYDRRLQRLTLTD